MGFEPTTMTRPVARDEPFDPRPAAPQRRAAAGIISNRLWPLYLQLQKVRARLLNGRVSALADVRSAIRFEGYGRTAAASSPTIAVIYLASVTDRQGI